jgi:hypothetical protein
MALSPEYGWPEPDNSSLVKNGAQDIRALGDAIDTSVWNVGYGQAGKNKIINGDFNINQRNFSSSTVNAEYNLDRWRTIYTGGTSTTSVQVFTLGAAPVAGYEGKNYYRVAITGQSASTDFVRMQEQVESVRTFAGQTTTYSFWAKADTGTPKVAIISVQTFGGGGSPSAAVTTEHGTVTLSTAWTRYSVTCVIPSISGKTLGTGGDDAISVRLLMSAGTGVTGHQSIGVQNYTFETWGHQWEYGSKATPFQTASGGSPQAELAMCQRYYWRATVDSVGDRFGYGSNISTTDAQIMTQYPVQMRTIPTALETSGTAGDYSVAEPGAVTAVCTAVPTFLNATNWSALTTFLTGGTLTQFRPSAGRAAAATAYLGWSAEL